nr:DDT domain-containing protein DDB_G0282237 [Ipomoea batatas]
MRRHWFQRRLLAKRPNGFPKELMAPVLRDVQFSMLSLKDLANTIAIKLQGCLSEGSELYGTMNSCVYPCKIERVLENEKPLYEVAWQDKYDKVRENTLLKEEDLIVKKLPCSKGALKLFIRESTYHSIPWVLHDKLAKDHGIPTHPPEELKGRFSLQDGLVVTNRKRKKSGDRKNDAEVDKDEFLDPKRKNTGREQHKGFTNEEIFGYYSCQLFSLEDFENACPAQGKAMLFSIVESHAALCAC